MSQDIISAHPSLPYSRLPHRLTDPVSLLPFSLPSPLLFPHPTSFPPAQLAMCRISECAKMKREKERRGIREGLCRSRDRDTGEGGEEELYISLVTPLSPSIRSFVRSVGRFGSNMDMLGMDISEEPGSHFQSVKSTSKSHTVFHRRGRSQRDRASFIVSRMGDLNAP